MNAAHEPIFRYIVSGFYNDEGYKGLYLPLHFVACKAQTPILVEVRK